jgi:hypothetical protein
MKSDPSGPDKPLTPEERKVMRLWIGFSFLSSILIAVVSDYTTISQDLVIGVGLSAAFATGCITMKRPAGFRVILGICAVTIFLSIF